MPKEERDLFKLDPAPVVFGDLDPNYTSLLFSELGLEKTDLASFFLVLVPKEVRDRVFLVIEESHTKYCEQVRTLNSIVRSLYFTAKGLVNDGKKQSGVMGS